MKKLKLLFAFVFILNVNAQSQTPFVIGLTIDEIKNTIENDSSFKIIEDEHKEGKRSLFAENKYFYLGFFAVRDTVYCDIITYYFKNDKDIKATIEYFDSILGKSKSNVWNYVNEESKINIAGKFHEYNCKSGIAFYNNSF